MSFIEIITVAALSTLIGLSWTKIFPPFQWAKRKLLGYDHHNTDVMFGLPDRATIKDIVRYAFQKLMGCTGCVSMWVSVGITAATMQHDLECLATLAIVAMSTYTLASQVDQHVD